MHDLAAVSQSAGVVLQVQEVVSVLAQPADLRNLDPQRLCPCGTPSTT